MRVWLASAAVLLWMPGLAQAQSAANAQGDVSVTIYNGDSALVEDVRQLNLPAGRVRQEFPDVSAQIRPETVTLHTADATIVEQNFDFDLLTPTALLDKAVGQTVTLVRPTADGKGETRESAKVLANNEGGAVVQIGERIEIVNDSDRLIFPSLPPNLRARPTLSVTLDSQRSGVRPVTLSYLTPGLSWNADYVALFDEKAGRIDVQGWVTLTNKTGTSFTNARTLLVAAGGGRNPRSVRVEPGTETANRERLGDFYLYPLAERTTIADAQQKQVSFLNVSGAAASKSYRFVNGWLGKRDQAASVDTVLNFSTASSGGLGDALPAGTVRVYMRDARGQPQFIGENRLAPTPMGSQIALKTGEAFDVKVQPVVETRERVNDSRWRTTMRYKLSNARPEPVTVELVQAGLDGWTDTRITSESQQSERSDASQALWRVAVPANGTAEVTATFDTRF